jgi:hypothetical protein
MYLVRLLPRRIRSAESFEAPDPWNHDAPARFALDAYKMTPERTEEPTWIHTLGQPELFGLRSAIDGTDRILPHFLSDLWRSGAVPARLLPGLAHAIASQLHKPDYFPPPLRSFAIAGAAGLLVAVPATLMRMSLANVQNAKAGLLLLAAGAGWTAAIACGLGLPFLLLRVRRAHGLAEWALRESARLG